MKLASAACGISQIISTAAVADVGFYVDSNGLIECHQLGEIAAGFAEHKRAGMSSTEMRTAMTEGGVYPEVAAALVGTLYSFDARERTTYSAVVSSLCVIDKLQPIELER